MGVESKSLVRIFQVAGIACALSGLGSVSARSQGLSVSAIARKASPSIVQIKGDSASGPTSGTGFLVSSDGKIVTALHVIEDLQGGAIRLANGELYDAFTVLSYDKRKDIAIIKISGFDLPFLELGNSNKVTQGDSVVLIGNPEGLRGTLTAGIISAIRDSQDGTFKVIQTDAASNPGNSGGPLLNLSGQVVGILDYKFKGSESLNFAIPINYARGLLKESGTPFTMAELRKRLGKNEAATPPVRDTRKPTESSVRYVASEGVISSLTIEQLKTILRGVQIPILDEKLDGGVIVMMNNLRVGIALETGKSLKFLLVLSDKYSCAELNKWNAETPFAFAWADKDGAGILGMDLYIGSGVTVETINSYITYFDGMVQKFVKIKSGK